ncbi:MAG: cytosine permease [Candidatus Levyibacteriota bacterium]
MLLKAKKKVDKIIIPVREGNYGKRILAVEPGGTEFIPTSQRHGNPLRLFWTWNSPNWEFATLFVGVVPVVIFGGSFWLTALGIMLGSLLGACVVGIFSSWGPKLGVPQMIQSRSAFGYVGNIFPSGLNAITVGVGWFAINSITGAFALSSFSNLSFQISLIIITFIQALVAFIGHNFIHQFEKFMFPILAIIFTTSSMIIFTQANLAQGFNQSAPLAFGGSLGAFIIAFSISFAYAGGWAPYSMDYSRYLPRNTRSSRVFWATMLGIFLPCLVLQVAGAALATIPTTSWGPSDNPVSQMVKILPSALGLLTLLSITLGGISANALNIYTGAMSFLATGIKLGGLKWQRGIVTVIFGIIGYLVARMGEVDFGRSYENFLLVLTYWIAPYLGVILTDFWLQKGKYDIVSFYNKAYTPKKGLIAMIAGIVMSIPFWNQALWHGPVVDLAPQLGDLSFLVGFFVSSLTYYLFKTRLK